MIGARQRLGSNLILDVKVNNKIVHVCNLTKYDMIGHEDDECIILR